MQLNRMQSKMGLFKKKLKCFGSVAFTQERIFFNFWQNVRVGIGQLYPVLP